MSEDDNSKQRTSRRQVLSGVGSSLLAFSSIQLVSGEVPKSAETIEIPKIMGDEGVLKTKEVPKKWWENVLKARRATKKLSDDISFDTVIHRRSGKDTIAGKNQMKLDVEVTSDTREDAFPASVNDIPIETIESADRGRTCVNFNDESNIPGGVAMTTEPGGFGTTGSPVYDDNDSYMLTAYHLFDPHINCGDIEDLDGYQVQDYFGQVSTHFDTDLDYAAVSVDASNRSLDDTIEHNNNRYDVSGWATNLEDDEEEGATMYKTGCVTGYTRGEIYSLVTNTTTDCLDITPSEGISWDMDQAGGDSGCAPFKLENFGGSQFAVVTGLASYGRWQKGTTSCSQLSEDPELYDHSAGATAEAIHNDSGLKFG